jgi:hypothetical protein
MGSRPHRPGPAEGDTVRLALPADAHDTRRLRQGDVVAVDGREAVFLYQRGVTAAVVRYRGESASRVVPAAKLERRAA